MSGIQDEGTLHAMVSIFAVLFPYYHKKQPENNLILKTFKSNEQFYKQTLIYLANRAGMYRLDKIMQTILLLISNQETNIEFTLNDYDVLIDAGLRELEQENPARARIRILEVLHKIICDPEYSEGENYASKMDFFRDRIENMVIHEEDDSPYAVKERINLMKINMKLNQIQAKKA